MSSNEVGLDILGRATYVESLHVRLLVAHMRAAQGPTEAIDGHRRCGQEGLRISGELVLRSELIAILCFRPLGLHARSRCEFPMRQLPRTKSNGRGRSRDGG